MLLDCGRKLAFFLKYLQTDTFVSEICAEGDCEAPPPVIGSNAYLVDKYAMMTSFSSGDKVYYSCNVGYTARAGSRSRRCKNGKWTQLKLKCERKLCGHAGEIENGHFVYTGVKFGDVATAKCNEGYILVGRATRNCMSQGWDGRIPVCEGAVNTRTHTHGFASWLLVIFRHVKAILFLAVAICDKPKKTNAISKGPEEPPYRYRSVIRYQCQVGTLDGPREIYCTSNGTWNGLLHPRSHLHNLQQRWPMDTKPSQLPTCTPAAVLICSSSHCLWETSYSLGPVLIYSQCCEDFLDVPGEDMP
uniref:C4b-binding protein alpha chain n=1 Tax=Oryzias latipes TaxID=8090 RepID=A0A3P9J791_ORYLA